MFSETTGLFGLDQDVKTRQRTPIVPKIDMGMAMMIAPTTIAARRSWFLGARNFILPSLDSTSCLINRTVDNYLMGAGRWRSGNRGLRPSPRMAGLSADDRHFICQP